MGDQYESLSQQMDTTRIDFYDSSGFIQLQEWRADMETVGASVELGFLAAFLLTGGVGTWNCFKRQQSLLHPRGALNLCVAAICIMRVVFLADPFGWLGVLQPWLRSCLYAIPQAALATMLAYLVALWQRLSRDALAKDRVRSQWSLGRLASPFIVIALLVCAAAVLTSILGSNALSSVYSEQETETAGVAIVSLVRVIYGLYTLGITVLSCIGMQRLLSAMSARAQTTVDLTRLHGLPPAPDATSACGLITRGAAMQACCRRRKTAPQSAHIVYRRLQAGFERQPVAIYKDGLQIADSSNVLDLAHHFAHVFSEGKGDSCKGRSAPYAYADADPSVDKLGSPTAQTEAQQYRSVRRKLLLACTSGLTILALWLACFAYCCIIRYVNAVEWLLYLAAEHTVELAGCWAVLFSVWPSSRPGRDSFDQGKDGEGEKGKEGSDKGFGQGADWAPLRARGRAKIEYKKKSGKLDSKLKEVWEDETLLAYLAMSMGLRGNGQRTGTEQAAGDGAYSALASGQDSDGRPARDPIRAAVSHVREVTSSIASGWRALLGLNEPTDTSATGSGRQQTQTATVVANPLQHQPAPVDDQEAVVSGPLDEDPSTASARRSTVGAVGGGGGGPDSPPTRHTSLAQPAPPSPISVPATTPASAPASSSLPPGAVPLAPGTVVTISLDTILSSPALRQLLVEAQERELNSCAQDRQALLQATAAAIAQSAREAIAQMRTIQDAVLEQSSLSPPAYQAQARQAGGAPQEPVTVYNPLRSLQPMNSTGSTGSDGVSSTSTSPSGSMDGGGPVDLPSLQPHTPRGAQPTPDTPRSERSGGPEDGAGGLPPSLVQWLATEWPSDRAVQDMVERTPALPPMGPALYQEEEAWVDMQSQYAYEYGLQAHAQAQGDNGALVDLLVWAHGEERRRQQEATELVARSSGKSKLHVRRRSLDSVRSHVRKVHGPSLAPLSGFSAVHAPPSGVPGGTPSTTHLDHYRGVAQVPRARAAAEKEIEMVSQPVMPGADASPSPVSPRASATVSPAVAGNPLAILAKAMQEKDAERRRERSKSRAVSMAEARGSVDEGEGAWPSGTGTGSRGSTGSGSEGGVHAGRHPSGDGDSMTPEDEAEWLASPEGKESVRKERVLQMLANLKARGKPLPPGREAELLRAMETQQRAGGVEGSLSARGQGSRAVR